MIITAGLLLCVTLVAQEGNPVPPRAVTSRIDFEKLGSVCGEHENDFLIIPCSVGDIDADGTPDLAAASSGIPGGFDEVGHAPYVLLVSGSSWTVRRRIELSPATEISGGYDRNWSGGVMTCVSDLNGDGLSDLAVCEVIRRGLLQAQVTIYSAADGQVLRRFGPASERGRMATLAKVQDLDADGAAELAIGWPEDGEAGSAAGAIEIVSSSTGKVIWRKLGEGRGAGLGMRLCCVADIDGDGLRDIVATRAPSHPDETRDRPASGAVCCLSTKAGELLWSQDGRAGDEYFGRELAPVGDMDGDGVGEVAVLAGARSPAFNIARVDFLSGRTGSPVWSFEKPEGFSSQLSLAGGEDVDGDGVADLLIGANEGSALINGSIAGDIGVLSCGRRSLVGAISGNSDWSDWGIAVQFLPRNPKGDVLIAVGATWGHGHNEGEISVLKLILKD